MGKWIVMFLHKYKDIILYIFFGLCTMIVNIITYWLSAKIFSSVVINTIVAWLIAVLFAYLTIIGVRTARFAFTTLAQVAATASLKWFGHLKKLIM